MMTRLRKAPYATMLASFIGGLFIHLFGLVNVLHNHDSIYRIPTGYGTGVGSGRWFLEILGELNEILFGGYNLAWLNGVLFIALVAASAGLIVRFFEVKELKLAVLIGISMVSFPSVASTLFYRFTSVYYGIAILAAIFAAFALNNYKYGFPVAVLCIALSMGIYQAYVSFTISILLTQLIKLCFDKDVTPKKIIVTGIYYGAALISGLIVYFLAMKLSLIICNVSLVDYSGISTMGAFSISNLPVLIKSAFFSIGKLLIKDYEGLAQTKLINICYLAIGLICAAEMGVLFLKNRQKPVNLILCFLLCALLPIAVNFVVIMCGIAEVYTLMCFSVVMILFMPIVFGDIIPPCDEKLEKVKSFLKKSTVIVLLIVTFSYSYQANTNYTIQYYNNQQITNYFNRIVTQVQMTEGYETEKKWVFIGDIADPLLTKTWTKVDHFGGNMPLKRLTHYRREHWIEEYLGIKIPSASIAETETLMKTDEVINMPCWPNEGSIQIIEEFVVIKFDEVE